MLSKFSDEKAEMHDTMWRGQVPTVYVWKAMAGLPKAQGKVTSIALDNRKSARGQENNM